MVEKMNTRFEVSELLELIASSVSVDELQKIRQILTDRIEEKRSTEALQKCRLAYASYIVNAYDYDMSSDDKDAVDWACLGVRMSAGYILDLLKDRLVDETDELDALIRTYAACIVIVDQAYRGGMSWMYYEQKIDAIRHCGIEEDIILSALHTKLLSTGVDRKFSTIEEAATATQVFSGEVIVGVAKAGDDVETIAGVLQAKGIPLHRNGQEPLDVDELRRSLA
jgi:hypothetical protein